MPSTTELAVLISQGQDIVDDLWAFIQEGTSPQTHWTELVSWHERSTALIADIAPQLSPQTKSFSASSDERNEIYPALRVNLSLLKGLNRMPTDPEAAESEASDGEIRDPMKVFVSYAHEDRDAAERIALALRESSHQVFFDRDALREGEGFHRAIREEIQSSDGMVFLVSPDSIADGSYCRSELKLARERWPHPRRSVLPVLVRETAWDSIPSYLRAVTIMKPEGDLAAEVEASIARWGPPSGE